MNNSNSLVVVCIAVLVSVFGCVKSDVFSSLDVMSKLPAAQKEVAQVLRKYIDVQSNNLKKLKTMVTQMEKFAIESNKNSKEFMGHPLNAFLVIKHLTMDLNRAVDLFKTNRIGDELNGGCNIKIHIFLVKE